MTTNDTLIYTEMPNGVAEITLNRPKVRNAFDSQLIQKLISTFKQAESSPTVRVILLQANGKHFSAGADLNWMRGMAQASYKENYEDAKQLALLMSTINYISKPVVAKVHGAAFGGAIGLIACSDIVIADKETTFCLSEVKLGLSPATISPYVIDAIGARAARRFFLTGEIFNSEKALSLGLISELTETSQLNNEINNIINSLLKNGPIALTKTKELIQRINTETRESTLIEYTCELIADLRVSEEGQEGLSAFLEKRVPSWTHSLAATGIKHDK